SVGETRGSDGSFGSIDDVDRWIRQVSDGSSSWKEKANLALLMMLGGGGGGGGGGVESHVGHSVTHTGQLAGRPQRADRSIQCYFCGVTCTDAQQTGEEREREGERDSLSLSPATDGNHYRNPSTKRTGSGEEEKEKEKEEEEGRKSTHRSIKVVRFLKKQNWWLNRAVNAQQVLISQLSEMVSRQQKEFLDLQGAYLTKMGFQIPELVIGEVERKGEEREEERAKEDQEEEQEEEEEEEEEEDKKKKRVRKKGLSGAAQVPPRGSKAHRLIDPDDNQPQLDSSKVHRGGGGGGREKAEREQRKGGGELGRGKADREQRGDGANGYNPVRSRPLDLAANLTAAAAGSATRNSRVSSSFTYAAAAVGGKSKPERSRSAQQKHPDSGFDALSVGLATGRRFVGKWGKG
ncbi:hypothetical protein CBR_g78757, partial [Chara braunii]